MWTSHFHAPKQHELRFFALHVSQTAAWGVLGQCKLPWVQTFCRQSLDSY